jgi:hypothetical protein
MKEIKDGCDQWRRLTWRRCKLKVPNAYVLLYVLHLLKQPRRGRLAARRPHWGTETTPNNSQPQERDTP